MLVRRMLLVMIVGVLGMGGCKKNATDCDACRWTGSYNGVFHRVAACYGCVPYLDSTFSGSFLVSSMGNDSVLITRVYDEYTWTFKLSDNGKYAQSGGLNSGFSFTFTETDSLYFFQNFGGGGGYFRETFQGKKLP